MAAGVGAVVAAGALLSLAAGALYLRARGKATGFGFAAFQVGQGARGVGGSGSPDLAQGPSLLSAPLRWKMLLTTTSPRGRKGPAPCWSPSPTPSLAPTMTFVSPLM